MDHSPLTKLGCEITWSGGDCKMMGAKGDKVEVTVVNGCPMVPRQLGMEVDGADGKQQPRDKG